MEKKIVKINKLGQTRDHLGRFKSYESQFNLTTYGLDENGKTVQVRLFPNVTFILPNGKELK